ncbi:paeninodin family lasso peptide [Ferviditalea candida]|uniref:Paeninodin family lasso peptide n=1 Tax=Ferviditalea candida TaxID=3108399 RepID=A0ABU5ZPQ0_9BACL|nr:paeninodin family lasso peptide [Paenibacillaceae bacterium T2]
MKKEWQTPLLEVLEINMTMKYITYPHHDKRDDEHNNCNQGGFDS